jgi:hypothetical protein
MADGSVFSGRVVTDSPEGLVGPSSAHTGKALEVSIAGAAGRRPRNRGTVTTSKEKCGDMGNAGFTRKGRSLAAWGARVRARSSPVSQRSVRGLVDAISSCRSEIAATLADVPEGWSVAPYDPSALLACFRRLRLREGVRLAAYHFRLGGHNNGVVFVVPTDRELPSPPRLDWETAPGPGEPLRPDGVPPWADRRLGLSLEGTKSPLSFFEASLLLREMTEIGATWRGRNWQNHTLLTVHPLDPPVGETAELDLGRASGWQWVRPVPADWRPLVWLSEDAPPAVEFYTHSGLYQERIVQHRDTFREGYSFETAEEAVAHGGEGFLF